MESLNNQNTYGNAGSPSSDVELTLFGIDKKWVRANGSWMDKSKVPTIRSMSERTSMEIEETSSHWWQFWKA